MPRGESWSGCLPRFLTGGFEPDAFDRAARRRWARATTSADLARMLRDRSSSAGQDLLQLFVLAEGVDWQAVPKQD
jgi:hypothetical protein